MTTSAADFNRKYFTVAELVARERTATESYPWAKPDRRPRVLMPATELLRREGVRIDGLTETPTQQVHVAKLLRRESGQPPVPPPPVRQEPEKPRSKSQRAAAIGSAAALCGLTIAGLIALKPATAPDSTSASGKHGGAQGDLAPSPGELSPTTTVLKRASSNEDTGDKARKPGGSPTTAGAPSSPGAGGEGPADSTTPSDDGPQQTSTPPADNPTTPPAEDPDDQPEEKPKPPDDGGDDGGGDEGGGLLDPILDPVGDLLDPLTGKVSGTLDGLTP